MVPRARVNPNGISVDLVDRDVDVLVIGNVVTHRDSLVLGRRESINDSVDNLFELSSFKAPIIGVK